MMFKDKPFRFCFSLLVLMVFAGAGGVWGQEPSGNELLPAGNQELIWEKLGLSEKSLLAENWFTAAAEVSTDSSELPFLMAQADTDKVDGEEPLSPECIEWRKNPDADIGVMLRAGCQPTIGQMSALMDNPLGNVAMLFTQIDITRLENPTFDKSDYKYNYMGIAQFPKGLGENWNIINRVIWNVPSMPVDQGKIDDAQDRAARQLGSGEGPIVTPPTNTDIAPIDLFSGRTTGFGDMYYNGLFSPKKGFKLEGGGSLLWGLGFDLGFPTATEDILGTGKWLAGPSGLGVYLGPKWKIGALVQQYWDYAGDSDRDSVSLMNLQYFIFYSLDEVTSIGAAPNIIANWEQDRDNAWTVPIGLGISRTFQFGKLPVRFGAEAHYSVIQPDDVVGQEWNFRFYVIPAVPSALFRWMD
ncbi:MAG: hypothetical protein OET21_11975 [Desulfobacterales bacterium]|jgi:hypothetical protein|nr:hypothetical protein [Desulfobacterales bacterium]